MPGLRCLQHLLELIRFSHTLFALPFALLAAVMAWTAPTPDGDRTEFSWLHLVGILVCMVFARSAAMAFNRIADRHLDAQNPRTAGRHLPAGTLSVPLVAAFTAACSAGFILGTLLFLPNRLPLLLSVPVLLFLFAYSLTKRFTSLAHFWLGAALMLAPVSVWIALRGQWVWQQPTDLLPAGLLGLAVMLWVSGFDIIYACQDVGFDVQARLRSVPVRLGVVGALRLAACCHAGMLVALVALPIFSTGLGLGWIYGGGLAAAAILLICEHRLVRPDDLSRVNAAFFHANWMLSVGLLIIGSVDLLI
jgi:4-hydroxybenzoate polyprenyltransferase